jgi:hypothetical protein
MTWRKRTITDMAREAQLPYFYQTGETANLPQLERFAELVRADERNACCAIVYGQCESDNLAQRTVDAIRARGTT